MRNPHLYPNLQRVNQLLLTMTGFFAVQPDVYEVLVFGSLVTDDYDRWSDLDMLVVTATAEQQRPLFEKLKKTHPMHYHRVFMRDSVSSGSYVSGCTFVGESVFHTLDLNFMDLAERQSPGSLDRFGEIRQLHYMMTIPPATIAPQHVAEPITSETVHEALLHDAINQTRKTLRRTLRAHAFHDEQLLESVSTLRGVLAKTPDDIVMSGGKLRDLAWRTIKIAEMMWNEKD